MAASARIVCVGGGYVSTYMLRQVRRLIDQGEIEVAVIDQNNYHTFHGLAAEMLSGQVQPGQIVSPSRRLFAGARFHNAVVDGIDLDRRIVTTSRALDGRIYEVPFDHLVLNIGSVDDLSRYPGIAEHTLRLKSYWDIFAVRSHLLRMLELAEYETEPEERRRLLTFVIAGGNFAGIEVATELVSHFGRLVRKEYPRIGRDEIRIIVIHAGERILPELDSRYPRLVDYAERYVAGLGVSVHRNVLLRSATAHEAILSDGTAIPTRTIISCTGTAQSPLLDQLGVERDERGRVKTDAHLRVLGHANLWAGGDCAAVPHPKGGYCPPLAIYAITAGRQIGRNLVRHFSGRPLEPYRFTGLGDACSLGQRRAVGHLKGIQVAGFPAWLSWRLFMFLYLPLWERRIRTLIDWMIWPLIGRDIVALQQKQQLALAEALFEPGQVIIREGDVGQSLYILRSGEVEIVKRGGSGEEIRICTLGPGSHFGEMAVFGRSRRTATVRALAQVRVLEVKRDTAEVLAGSMEVLGTTLRSRPDRVLKVPQ